MNKFFYLSAIFMLILIGCKESSEETEEVSTETALFTKMSAEDTPLMEHFDKEHD